MMYGLCLFRYQQQMTPYPEREENTMESIEKLMSNCTLCPRNCHANRIAGQLGYCGMPATLMAARAALHMWEEPCLTGTNGSGTVFFSGCSLKCVFCQNHDIATGQTGKEISIDRLTDIFFDLEKKGATNINLVTPSHYIPQISRALSEAKFRGLKLPIVYNCGGYEKPESLRMLDGLIDIYLPDLKYFSAELSYKYSHASDYFTYANAALAEMYRQTGSCCFDDQGIMRRGIIVRHLLLPGQTKDSKKILRYLHDTYGDNIWISIMNQYTPLPHASACPELSRKVTQCEYDRVVDFAIALGIHNAFIQEGETAEESFIPPFNLEGI